jgi:hypothetical protein
VQVISLKLKITASDTGSLGHNVTAGDERSEDDFAMILCVRLGWDGQQKREYLRHWQLFGHVMCKSWISPADNTITRYRG